jgi:ornithine carbamoyltransferase
MPKSLLSIFDLDKRDIERIIDRAIKLRNLKEGGKSIDTLKGKAVGMIFEKLSTRTRISFEVGINQLGGYALYINPSDLQLGRGESVADTARVISSYLDGVIIRTFDHERVNEFAINSSIPVINALTNLEHPCQIISDLFTLTDKGLDIEKMKLAYVGDGNNVANTLIGAAAIVGFHISIATPTGYEPNENIIKHAKSLKNGKIDVSNNPKAAMEGADVLYTDVWISMGQEKERRKISTLFKPFQMNKALISSANPNAFVMHCLPAHRGEEITDDVVDGPQSIVFEQAANRLVVGQAILEACIGR